jgi:ATP-dependent Zn protease
VASFTEITGKKVRKITIIPEKIGELSTLGYAQYKHVPTKGEPDRAYLVRVIAGLLAGSEAEGLIERTTTTGRGNDVQKVGEIARRIVLENHLLPGLDSAHAYVEKDGQIVNTLPPRKRRIFEDYVDKAIDEARALAIETLKKHWEVVEAGVKILMEKGVIDGEEFDALMAQDRAANDCSANLELPL